MPVIKQHYVPQFFLRFFGWKGKKKYLINIYNIQNLINHENVCVEDICREEYFYGEDGIIETDLAKLETEWASNFRRVIDGRRHTLLPKIKVSIYKFIAYQLLRTLSAKKYLDDSITGLEDLLRYKGIKLQPLKKDIKILLSMPDEVYEAIRDLNSVIIDNTTDVDFIISDNPCICTNIFTNIAIGLKLIGTIIFIPISPKRLLLLYDRKSVNLKLMNYRIINKEEINSINSYQYINANQLLIGNNFEFFTNKVHISKLEGYRKQKMEYNKIDSVEAGRKLLVTNKSDFIPYYVNIPWIELDYSLGLIPEISRYPISRIIDKDQLDFNLKMIKHSDIYSGVIQDYWKHHI
ncbi:DUF4238 domain-containing protein [Veillonella parvula]|jgi:hypothetical protein|uniref:DUF4238 domain-containing protein n=1 Tax=Veillonella parvula TaxID=29466 RepID=UPI001D08F052|nr:DUF4238 domain-containing protein [Veillonella parvula]MDU4225376.1 DUF4238 domain-containing protein [Streptococcus sp.]MCB6804810.1 DUF4238 domain-containing protein [Veillonella parvula]MCQ4926130.1 DUF4238 domain-containing protein [Veillonella parvula]MCQ4957320.1 DUF4238 domain-containing protein [Veillonella parvula]MDU4429877.1 DUF4238 domain-containing protein [Veillonella parvula]